MISSVSRALGCVLRSVTVGHSMVTSAHGVMAGPRSCPHRFGRIAVFLMGRAGGNSLMVGVKRGKTSLVSLCPHLDSVLGGNLQYFCWLESSVYVRKSDLKFIRAVWGSCFSQEDGESHC